MTQVSEELQRLYDQLNRMDIRRQMSDDPGEWYFYDLLLAELREQVKAKEMEEWNI